MRMLVCWTASAILLVVTTACPETQQVNGTDAASRDARISVDAGSSDALGLDGGAGSDRATGTDLASGGDSASVDATGSDATTGSDGSSGADAGGLDATGPGDAGSGADAPATTDAMATTDAVTTDATTAGDAVVPDAGAADDAAGALDATPGSDTTTTIDAGSLDTTAASDAGSPADAAAEDAWVPSYPDGFCSTSQCFEVPPGNQSLCYGNTAAIECPAYPCQSDGTPAYCGQDSQVPDRSRSFTCLSAAGAAVDCASLPTASAGEVVVDSLTHLTWQRTWTTGLNWAAAVAHCADLDYAGQQDWRLPNPFELHSLVDEGRASPAIDTVVFPGTSNLYWWTAVERANSTGEAWTVNGGFGRIGSVTKTQTSGTYVRCVRGGATGGGGSFERFVTTGSGEQVVLDAVTGRSWQAVTTSDLTWVQALQHCESSTHGGFADWHLPSNQDLLSLLQYGRHSPASDFPTLPSARLWSSTTFVNSANNAWAINADHGYISEYDKDEPYTVICVR